MTPAEARPPEFTPIFDWSAPHGRKVSLFSFVAASAVLHALCFYVFQIVYPPTIALLPPPARVNLITGDSEAGRFLWNWVEAEDPALASTTQRPPDTRDSPPPAPSHVPSYAEYRPELKQLPPYQPDLRVPSSQPPGPVRLQRSSATPAPTGTVTSRVKFAGNVASLGTPAIPSFEFTASNNELPAAAQFRIGVSPRGAVRYCFLENSSGDAALDEQARRLLLLCRFPAIERSVPPDLLLWTSAALEWGNDIVVPGAKSAEPPAP